MTKPRASNNKKGRGGKTTRAPAAFNRVSKQKEPSVQQVPGGIRVRGRVALVSVDASLTFGELEKIYINPNSEPFGRLSTIASAYETFEPKALSFDYEGACGTDVDARVFMVWDPDPSDPLADVAGGEIEMMRAGISTYSTAWGKCSLKAKLGSLVFPKLFMDKENEADTNHTSNLFERKAQRLSTAGALIVATSGESKNAVGFIWCNYDFIFRTLSEKPRNSASFYVTDLSQTGTIADPWSNTGVRSISAINTHAAIHTVTGVGTHIDFALGAGKYLLNASINGAGITGLNITTPLVNASGSFGNNSITVAATSAHGEWYLFVPYDITGALIFVITGATVITSARLSCLRYANFS